MLIHQWGDAVMKKVYVIGHKNPDTDSIVSGFLWPIT